MSRTTIKAALHDIEKAVDRLTEAVKKAAEPSSAVKHRIQGTCGVTFGDWVCDLPAEHENRYQHRDSRKPRGFQEFMP